MRTEEDEWEAGRKDKSKEYQEEKENNEEALEKYSNWKMIREMLKEIM